MTKTARVRALSLHADYRCRDTGACCTSGWAIPVEPETEDRLRSALRSGALRIPRRADPDAAFPSSDPGVGLRRVDGLPHGARVVLRTDQSGRCAFFDPSRRPSGLCAVHGGLGEDALPSSCRQFPRVVTLTPLGVSVTLSHYCPTAAGMLFEGDEALRVVENPRAFPADWPYEGLDARDALPPFLRPGVLMDWPSLERWEQFAVAVLAEDRTPDAALDVLAAAAEEARAWTPARGAFGEYFERVLDAACGRGRDGGGTALDRPIRRWLAARAFASWVALQGGGLRTTVAFLRLALDVLRAEATRGPAETSTRVVDAGVLKEAIRGADLRLVHLADPEALARRLSRGEAGERPATAW